MYDSRVRVLVPDHRAFLMSKGSDMTDPLDGLLVKGQLSGGMNKDIIRAVAELCQLQQAVWLESRIERPQP